MHLPMQGHGLGGQRDSCAVATSGESPSVMLAQMGVTMVARRQRTPKPTSRARQLSLATRRRPEALAVPKLRLPACRIRRRRMATITIVRCVVRLAPSRQSSYRAKQVRWARKHVRRGRSATPRQPGQCAMTMTTTPFRYCLHTATDDEHPVESSILVGPKSESRRRLEPAKTGIARCCGVSFGIARISIIHQTVISKLRRSFLFDEYRRQASGARVGSAHSSKILSN